VWPAAGSVLLTEKLIIAGWEPLAARLARLASHLGRSGHRSAGYDPLHRLAGDLRDQFVITVVVQNGDTFSFGDRRGQQIGQADRLDVPAPLLPTRSAAPGPLPLADSAGGRGRQNFVTRQRPARFTSCAGRRSVRT